MAVFLLYENVVGVRALRGAVLPLADGQPVDLRLRDRRRARRQAARLVAVPRQRRPRRQRGVVLRLDAAVPRAECTAGQLQGLPRPRGALQPVRSRKSYLRHSTSLHSAALCSWLTNSSGTLAISSQSDVSVLDHRSVNQ